MAAIKKTPVIKPAKSKKQEAEKELKKMLDTGKVKDLEKARNKIYKKYGVRPNGMTN
jgi:hypothetical protein